MNQQLFFETIKCKDFEVFNLNYHKKRMADTVGLNFDLQEYIYPSSEDLLKCKLVYNQEQILNITYEKYTPKNIKKFKLIYDDCIDYRYKNINRNDIDQLYKQKESSDEIIIIKNSFVTDTSIANIAIYLDNQWLTPKTPLLYGTTRSRYIENGKIKEKDITVNMLRKASKIALLNAMIDFKELKEFYFN